MRSARYTDPFAAPGSPPAAAPRQLLPAAGAGCVSDYGPAAVWHAPPRHHRPAPSKAPVFDCECEQNPPATPNRPPEDGVLRKVPLLPAWGGRTKGQRAGGVSRRYRVAELPTTAIGVDPATRGMVEQQRTAGAWSTVAPFHRRYGYYSRYTARPGGAAQAITHNMPGGRYPCPTTVYTKA
eukprot:Hpha_TRINITY_DN15485_c0_g1::TRINITY_DN15485_c0_g1_i3::g.177066::m.177066